VGDVTLLMPCGNQNINRAYVVGVTPPYTCFLTRWDDQDVVFEGPSLNELWRLRMTDEFYPASSNVYSIDHIFDADNCFHFLGIVHSPAFLYLGLNYATGQRELSVHLNCTTPGDPGQFIPLALPSPYWLPRDLP